MQEEIQKIIDDNLPSLAANQMKEFIKQAEQDKVTLDEVKNSLLEQDRVVEDLRESARLHADMSVKEQRMNQREEAVAIWEKKTQEREDRADIALMEAKVQSMTDNMANMKELVTKVFGHPSVSISRSVPVAEHPPSVDQYGNTQYGGITQHSESETTLETKL